MAKAKSIVKTRIKSRPGISKAREQRIAYEIIVDAYTREEQVMGWYYYLEGKLRFPFRARCIAKRAISPLRVGEQVEVIRMAPEEDCWCEPFVIIPWEKRTVGVPLAQVKGIAVDKDTKQAIEDWHYWLQQGYQF
jgi:hypothetical protein